ncbi:nucleoside phosphorylase [Gottschalkiaceae bacterium SANA]|nr:nucleoside phosphorylase [Gottschalkiaceae bacterium SANA]
MKQPHILCEPSEIARYALLPGDPERVLRVAEFLDDWKEIAYNREFRTITGTYQGVAVTVTSTGIGGASACIAIEELSACGADTLIRIGSAGASQPEVEIGDLIISTGAVREEGASRMYVEHNYPAVPHFSVLRALVEEAEAKGLRHFVGLTRSHDSFYIDDESERMAKAHKNKLLGSDMETSALFVIASLRGLRAGSILNNVVKYESDVKEGINDYVDEADRAAQGEKQEILIALGAIKRLAERDLLQGGIND